MAVFKKLTCKACRSIAEVATQLKPKDVPPCPKCGAEGRQREYGAKWIVRLMVPKAGGGSRQYYKAVSPLKAEAVAHEAKMLVERTNPTPQAQRITFEAAADFFETWITSKLGESAISPGTAARYRSAVKAHLSHFFAGRDMGALTETDIEAYRTWRRSAAVPPKPASVNREVGTLKRITSLLHKRRMLPVDPLAGIEMLKENNGREYVLTPDQISAMLAEARREAFSERLQKWYSAYPDHLYVAILIALNTGLRKDGVLTLRWSEIDWERGEIKKVVKGGKEIRIPMSSELTQGLREWRRSRPNISTYVLPSPTVPNEPMRVTSNFGFERLVATMGIPDFHFHDLRHTFATYFIQHTKDIHLVAQILGHSTVYITTRYVHLVREQAREAMATFNLVQRG